MAKETVNFKFVKPDKDDFYDIDIENKNWDKADEELKNLTGNIGESVLDKVDSIDVEFPEPQVLDKSRTAWGKVKKFIADFNAFRKRIVTDEMVVNNGSTVASGKVLDARYGKSLKDGIELINDSLATKAPTAHTHDDRYYTESEINTSLATKVNQSVFNDHVNNNIKHVTSVEKANWNGIYQQSTGYTNQKIAQLINGAPETLDTLKEVADAIATHETVVDALDKAIGTKVNQSVFDTHASNSTTHVTAVEKAEWNSKANKSHADATLVHGGGTGSNYGHVKLSDSYETSDGASSNSVAASSWAVWKAYNTLNTNLEKKSNTVLQAITTGSGFTGGLDAGSSGYVSLSINVLSTSIIIDVRAQHLQYSGITGLQFSIVFVSSKSIGVSYYSPRAIPASALVNLKWVISYIVP